MGDDKQKSRIEAKNGLEGYTFQMKSTVEDEAVGSKLSDSDKETVINKCKEVLAWLDANQMAERDEFDHQKEELEKVCKPIITNLYAGAGGAPGGMPGGMPEVCPVVCLEVCL